MWGSRKYPECETSTEVNFLNLQFLFTSAYNEIKMRAYNKFITYINVEIYEVVKRAFERWLLENLKARKEAHIANCNLFHPEYTRITHAVIVFLSMASVQRAFRYYE